jgi:hypothetical protein
LGVLEKIDAARGVHRKGWSQPLSWAYDDFRAPFLSTYPLTPDRETIENDFEGYIRGAYKANGIVFACIAARQGVFSQARFKWRNFVDGEPGKPYGNQDLRILEKPWATGTTGELLSMAEVDVSLAGNFWATTVDDKGRMGRAATGPGRRVARMRPDWVTQVIGSHSGDPYALDAKVVGILYHPRPMTGYLSSSPSNVDLERATLLLPSEVCHYSPYPDPEARFRGMSWLTPVIREVQADKAATQHKLKFFEQGATPQVVFKFDRDVKPEDFYKFKDLYNAEHQGTWNAYKALFLAGGADVEVIGTDLKQLEFSATQGRGETRVAVAARVPAVILGISEGLGGSALNAGNYGQARRNWAEGALQDLWSKAAASFQNLVTPPGESTELFADTRSIPFLREDAKDIAEIQQKNAVTLRQLTDAGFDPDAAIDYLLTDDLATLKGKHSGLFSVQLQPPGTEQSVTVTDVEKAVELLAAGWKAVTPPLKEITA